MAARPDATEWVPAGPARPRPLWLVVAAVCGVLLFGTMVYSHWFANPTLGLAAHLAQLAHGPDGVEFDFAREVDGPWDTLHVFGPYTEPDEIERRLGFAWDGAAASRSQHSDAFQLLVFVEGRFVTGHVDVGRELIAPAAAIPRDQATFVVRDGTLRWTGGD